MKLCQLFNMVSIAVLGLIAASPALAYDGEFKTVVKRPKVVFEDTSEANRIGKSYSLTAQIAGSAVSPVPSLGVNLGFFMTSDSLLQLEYTKGKSGYGFFDLEAQTYAVNLKYFAGNSFYTKIGGVYRQVEITNFECFLCSSKSKSNLGSADSIALELAVGNQWQWQSFTLGCDWIGAMVPVARTRVTNNYAGDKDIDESTKEDLNESWNRLSRTVSLQLLRFYLGASF